MADAELAKSTAASHFGLPVIDVGERFASTDWEAVERCRPDDVGIVTNDGLHLTTEAEIAAFWRAARAASA